MEPKYKVGDQVECTSIIGWIVEIFQSMSKNGSYLYAVEEPESESVGFYTEQELGEK